MTEEPINPTQELKRVTMVYFAEIRDSIGELEKMLQSGVNDMDTQDHARSAYSLVTMAIPKLEGEMKKLGEEYVGRVQTLRFIVTKEYQL